MMDKSKFPYLIAEVGQAHDGSLGLAHSYIDALAETGVDAVKFQMHIAEAESSVHEPFRVKFSYEDETRQDYWNRMGFTFQQWKGLKEHCEQLNLDFICSPFSNLAVDWLEELEVKVYKIGSGEVTNFLLLEKIARTGKPVILSSGMSDYSELDAAVSFLRSKNIAFSILQCTTAYPAKPEELGLNVIHELKKRYGCKVGFSDHSSTIAAGIAAVALGSDILEFHAVFDKRSFGPDSRSSLTIDEVGDLAKAAKQIYTARKNPVDKSSNVKYEPLKKIFEKSLAVNKNLSAGHILTFEDLESKKPSGFGIAATDFQNLIGKKLKIDRAKWDFLNKEDIE